MTSSWILLLALLPGLIQAAPSSSITERDRPEPGRSPTAVFNVFSVSPPWDADPVLISGSRCVSPCGQGITYAHTTSVTYGLDFGIGGGPGGDLTKIFASALSGGFSASWSTSDTHGTSTSVDCPTGAKYICGLQATSQMVTTKGTKITTEHNVTGDKVGKAQVYRVDAPALSSAGTEPAIVTYATCLYKPLPDGAKESDYKGTPFCPGV